MQSRRRLALFVGLVVYILEVSLVLGAVFTDFWVQTGALRRGRLPSASSHVHFGLFHGIRQLDHGRGPHREYFSVFDELPTSTAFANKSTWVLTILSLALGLLWSFVALVVCLLALVTEEVLTVTGPRGLHLWNSLAVSSYGCAMCLFLRQYYKKMRYNVLLEGHLLADFSSDGTTRLGISFWTFLTATIILIIPSILILITERKSEKHSHVIEQSDPTILLY